MRTDEEILEYISENEPTEIEKCPISERWLVRKWNTGGTTITETYTYKNEPLHRQSFAVKNVIRGEVKNV